MQVNQLGNLIHCTYFYQKTNILHLNKLCLLSKQKHMDAQKVQKRKKKRKETQTKQNKNHTQAHRHTHTQTNTQNSNLRSQQSHLKQHSNILKSLAILFVVSLWQLIGQ